MRKRLFDLVVLIFCLLLNGYFGWHYLYGSRSLATVAATKAQVETLSAELAGEIAIRQAAEARVALLRPENLDLDMLDETARHTLFYIDPNEIMVPLESSYNNSLN